MLHGSRTNAALPLTLALALVAILPASAGAAVSVSKSGATLQIAATNVNPFVTIDHNGDYVISDAGGVSPGPGCTANGSGEAFCDDSGVTQLTLSALPDGGAVMSGNVVDNATGDSILLNGGSGNDIFTSGDGNDTLHGAAGSNDIDGADGDDTIDTTGVSSQILTGGDGSDEITGAGGFNFIDGGEFDGDNDGDGGDILTGGALQDNIDGGGGNDTINAGGDDDLDIIGGPGNDTINGGAGDDELDGGRNPSGAQDTDTLNGDENDDTLLNSDGPDTFNGGVGSDTVDYSVTTGSGAITADADGQASDDGRSAEQDTVGATVENLIGDGGDDTLTGNAQANDLQGEGGDDTLKGGSGTGADGADRFDGGTGSGDTVTYEGRTGGVVVDIDGTADDGAGGCPAGGGCEDDDLETTVENVVGGSGTDTITGSASANRLRGGAGTGNDVLNGLGSDDDLFGGTGANTGPDGADEFNGGTGDDLATYEGRTDGVTASIAGGDDGAGGCPSAPSCEDDDVASDVEDLTGGGGSDTLSGDGDGNDIDGGPASDVLAGGTATSGSDGPDIFTGGTGTDQVTYANRTTAVFASIDGSAFDGHDCPVTGPCEKDNVGTDVEQLVGGSDDDTLIGDADNNALLGNGGDDDLQGGETDVDGRDIFGGGDGVDRVSYSDKTRDLNVTLGGGNDGAGGCPDGAGCEDDNVPSDVEEVVGGDGDDTLTGNTSDNQVIGGQGDDLLGGGGGADGADRFAGGTNTDRVTYSDSSGNRELTIDGVANDGTSCPGASCEGDDIELDVENVTGGSGNDHIVGDLDANSFDGAGGDDTLEGGGTGSTADGADSFTGGPGTHDAVSYDNRTVSVTAVAGAGSVNGIGGCPGGAGCEDDVFAADIEDLTGGQQDDVLSGGSPTANTLDGQGGDDLLRGSAGSTGPDGADVFIGGGHGTAGGANGNTGDLVDYGSRTDNLTVSIGGGADGAAGESDDVRSTVEKVTGGDGSDTLTGDGAVNALVGGASDDTISGGSGAGPDGADVLTGGTGTGDTVSYATRTDGLGITINGTAPDGDIITTFENATGGSGNDTINGTGVPNTLTGGLGNDNLNGLAGADRLEARDGLADSLDCGTEADVAVVDFGTTDTFTGCETVDAAAPPPPPPPDPPANPDPGSGAGSPPPSAGSAAQLGPGETGAGSGSGASTAALPLSLTGNRTTLTLSSRGKLTIAVQGTPDASGQLTIKSARKVKVGKGKKAKRKIVTLAKARFRVGANGSVKVPLTVSASNRKLLAALKKINAVVTAATSGQAPATAKVTIKPAPKRRRSR